jgi:hypothetical protein
MAPTSTPLCENGSHLPAKREEPGVYYSVFYPEVHDRTVATRGNMTWR